MAILVGEDSSSDPSVKVTPNASNKVTGTPLNELYTFESFVGGKSNQIARAAALQIAENPGQSYNPFFYLWRCRPWKNTLNAECRQ